MADGQAQAGAAYQPYSNMTDIQFKNNLAQLHSTVAGVSGYASPTPQSTHSKGEVFNSNRTFDLLNAPGQRT